MSDPLGLAKQVDPALMQAIDEAMWLHGEHLGDALGMNVGDDGLPEVWTENRLYFFSLPEREVRCVDIASMEEGLF